MQNTRCMRSHVLSSQDLYLQSSSVTDTSSVMLGEQRLCDSTESSAKWGLHHVPGFCVL